MSAHLPDFSGKKPRTQNHIFVSYSSKDRAFVDRLAQDLRQRGHVVWIDFEGIRGGDLWRQSIADGLHASAYVLLVLSPESVASEWVEEEIRIAREQDKPLIPLLLRPVTENPYPTLQWVMAEVQYIDFTKGYQTPFERLLEDLPKPETGIAGHCQKLIAELAALPWGLDNYIQEHAKILPMNASPYEDGVVRRERLNLLDHLWNSQRVIVLGEPGIGKTVALERLAWELARHDPLMLPITVRLLNYDGQPLLEWVRLDLIRHGEIKLKSIEETRHFLENTPFEYTFLLDGLNEVRPEHREQAIIEITKLAMEYPNQRLIVSSRVQDESWQRLRQGSTLKESVVVQPIEEWQIQRYLAAHLDVEDGAQLWGQLDDKMRGLATTPLLLWLLKEAWLEERQKHPDGLIRVPDNRGALYKNFVARMLRKDDERQLTKQVTEDQRTTALRELALVMNRRQSLTISREEALSIIGNTTTLEAILVNGLLRGRDELRFGPHQTVQEHFAALALLQFEDDRRPAWLVKIGMAGKSILQYAAEPWWAETFIQLAGLTPDPNRLAQRVATINPWLAWWCVEEGGKVDEKTYEAIAAKSYLLVESSSARDRLVAAKALANIQQTSRVIQYLAPLSVDRDGAVARTALPALLNHGEDGEKAFKAALLRLPVKDRAEWGRNIADDDPRHGVGLTADGLPDIDWVIIPAGDFLYGNDNRTLHLETFHIARYPITYAQFQAFVDDRDGARQNCWYQGMAADADDRKIAAQQFKYTNHPRENVNWYNVMAFCRWLTWRMAVGARSVTSPDSTTDFGHASNIQSRVADDRAGYDNRGGPDALSMRGGSQTAPLPPDGRLPVIKGVDWQNPMTWWVRLPTEFEWEKAARGTDGRIYPYGNQFDASKSNTYETNLKMSSPVGIFPDGVSPYGVEDVSGNVWEWCLTEYSQPVQLDISNFNRRVLRGGSWASNVGDARAVRRSDFDLPNLRNSYFGGRVVCVHPPSL